MTDKKISCAVERKGWNGSSWIRKEKRLAIYLRDGFICCYCGINLHNAMPQDINLDHILPRSKGGGNAATNLITTCKRCNSGRGAKAVNEYATCGALNRIAGYRRRDLKPYIALAKELIAGRTGSSFEEER